MSEIKLEKVWRVRPKDVTGWYGDSGMRDSEHGGYVPYTTYCHNVAKLQGRVKQLEKTIVKMIEEVVGE